MKNWLYLIVTPFIFSANIASAAAEPRLEWLTSTHSGSGCPQGSVTSTYSSDNTEASFDFDAFNLKIGKNAKKRSSKSCKLEIRVKVPTGYRLIVGGFESEAELNLGKKARSTIRTAAKVSTSISADGTNAIFQTKRGKAVLENSVFSRFRDPAVSPNCGSEATLTFKVSADLRPDSFKKQNGKISFKTLRLRQLLEGDLESYDHKSLKLVPCR